MKQIKSEVLEDILEIQKRVKEITLELDDNMVTRHLCADKPVCFYIDPDTEMVHTIARVRFRSEGNEDFKFPLSWITSDYFRYRELIKFKLEQERKERAIKNRLEAKEQVNFLRKEYNI